MDFEDQDDEERPSYHNSPTRNNSPSTSSKLTKYKECLKNHALSIGGHAVDGCGEFTPSVDDSLKCAACNCHRSFHRKENFGGGGGFAFQHFTAYYHHRVPSGYLQAQHQRPTPLLALPSTSGGGEMEEYYGGMGGRKRYRTKFTAEQKEKMVKLAGRVGWRIQKQDEEIVEEFCREMGIKRKVLKVWMHNNKHTLGAAAAAVAGKKTQEINTNDNDNASFPN